MANAQLQWYVGVYTSNQPGGATRYVATYWQNGSYTDGFLNLPANVQQYAKEIIADAVADPTEPHWIWPEGVSYAFRITDGRDDDSAGAGNEPPPQAQPKSTPWVLVGIAAACAIGLLALTAASSTK